MHCGKKWWIREFIAPYIFPLNSDYVAARSLRSLRSNNNNHNNHKNDDDGNNNNNNSFMVYFTMRLFYIKNEMCNLFLFFVNWPKFSQEKKEPKQTREVILHWITQLLSSFLQNWLTFSVLRSMWRQASETKSEINCKNRGRRSCWCWTLDLSVEKRSLRAKN